MEANFSIVPFVFLVEDYDDPKLSANDLEHILLDLHTSRDRAGKAK